MFDDWELDNFEIQTPIIYTKEQIKTLQERVLVEESDITLSRELFNQETPEKIIQCKDNSNCVNENINKKIKKEKECKKSSKVIEHKLIKGEKEKNIKKNINYDDMEYSHNNYDDYLDYEEDYYSK
jgi:anaerobic ribonucleoside-triphosphate reductase